MLKIIIILVIFFLEVNATSAFITRSAFREAIPLRFEPDRMGKTLEEKMDPVDFDPADVKPGSIVYVREPDMFFKVMHAHIAHPYIIVTHGDVCDEYKVYYSKYLNDPKVIAWFGIHPSQKGHKKFFPIPIGVIGLKRFYDERKKMNAFFEELRNQEEREVLLGMNFIDRTHYERIRVRNMFEKKKYCTSFGSKPTMDYFKDMGTCKFVLSPRGAAIDCYRTWEAILCGAYPIVTSSQLNRLFKDLPVVIARWSEVNEKFLYAKYQEMKKKKYNFNKLYAKYWLDQIKAVQAAYFEAAEIPFEANITYTIDDENFNKQLALLKIDWKKQFAPKIRDSML